MLVWTTGARAADSDVQLWPVVTLHHGLTERWGAHLQVRGRFDEDVSHAKDLLVRPFASWRALDSLTVDLGYDYIHAFQADTEHRVWEVRTASSSAMGIEAEEVFPKRSMLM